MALKKSGSTNLYYSAFLLILFSLVLSSCADMQKMDYPLFPYKNEKGEYVFKTRNPSSVDRPFKRKKKRKTKQSHEESESPVDFSQSLDLQFAMKQRHFVNSPNPLLANNYGLFDQGAFADVNGDFKWKTPNWQLAVRPEILALTHRLTSNTKPAIYQWKKKSNSEFREIYVTLTPSGDFSLSFGRQKYEWGPTEFYNVSNPFNSPINFDSYQQQIVLPPTLIKASQSFSDTWNFTAVFNADDTIEDRIVSNISTRVLDKAYVLKFENTSLEGDYLYGFTYGSGQITAPFVGAYARWLSNSGFSIYTDMKQSQGSPSYYPVNRGTSAFPLVELQDKYFRSTKKTFFMNNIGIRFENNWDIRVEYLTNEAGFSKNEIELFSLAFSPFNFYSYTNAKKLNQMHLPFMRENYGYLSLRSPEFGPQKRFTLSNQMIQNLDDQSLMNIAKVDCEVGENGTLTLNNTTTKGSKTTGEFSSFIKDYTSLIFKWEY